MLSMTGFCSSILPCPVGIGNWVNLNSVEADSRLLWRSSKLTEGRNSKEPLGSSTLPDAAFRPKEKREWLLDDDAWSIGSVDEEDVATGVLLFMWLMFSLALKRQALV